MYTSRDDYPACAQEICQQDENITREAHVITTTSTTAAISFAKCCDREILLAIQLYRVIDASMRMR